MFGNILKLKQNYIIKMCHHSPLLLYTLISNYNITKSPIKVVAFVQVPITEKHYKNT